MDRLGGPGRFLLVSVLFGGTFPAIEVGLGSFPPLTFAATRYAISAAVLFAYAAATAPSWRPRTRGDRAAVAAGGTLLIGGTGLTFLGQQYTTGGVASILVSLVPIVTVIVAWVLLPAERPTRRDLAGVVVGFAGVALVVRPTPAALLDASIRGRLLVLGSATAIGVGGVLVKRADPAMPTVALTAWSMALGAGLLGVAALLAGESTAPLAVTPAALGALLYLAVLASGVGFVLYFGIVDRAGPLEAGLVSYVVPLVALAVGWALLDEPVQPAAVGGFLLVLAGFALLKQREIVAEVARYRGAGR